MTILFDVPKNFLTEWIFANHNICFGTDTESELRKNVWQTSWTSCSVRHSLSYWVLQICKKSKWWQWWQPSHLLSVDVTVLDEGGAADVDRHVLGRLAVLDEALLHIVLLAFLLLQQKLSRIAKKFEFQKKYYESFTQSSGDYGNSRSRLMIEFIKELTIKNVVCNSMRR